MNLEKARENVVTNFQKLKKFIQYAEFYLYEDLQIPEEPLRISFNGWSIPESYYSQGIESLFDELNSDLLVLEIFEPNQMEIEKLVKWMVYELSFDQYFTSNLGNEIPYHIPAEKLVEMFNPLLKDFESKRKEGHDAAIKILNNYLKSPKNEIKKSKAKIEKFIWHGEQRHLSELFHTLIMKGWIKASVSPTENARAILEAFDISETKKKHDSDPIQSFFKAFNGENDNKLKERIHPAHPEYLKAHRYKPFFNEIKDCPNAPNKFIKPTSEI